MIEADRPGIFLGKQVHDWMICHFLSPFAVGDFHHLMAERMVQLRGRIEATRAWGALCVTGL